MVWVVFFPALAWAGRPLTVDDAGAVAPDKFEIELGASFYGNSRIRHYDVPVGLTMGLVPTLEAGAGLGGQIEEREQLENERITQSGFGDFRLGAKWNPLSEQEFWVSQALAFTVKLPTADHHFGSGEADFDLTYIASRKLSERFNAHLNAGYTWTGEPGGESIDDILHCGTAVGFVATRRTEFVAELYADIPETDEARAPLIFNAGLRYAICDGVVFDASAGAGLRGDAPDWLAVIGLTWTFGLKKQARPY